MFEYVHDGAFDADDGEDDDEEDHDFAAAGPKRVGQDGGLLDVAGHFHNAEHAHEAQDADGHEVVCVGDGEFDPGRENGQEVDDTEEAGDVTPTAADYPESQGVLNCKDGREGPFELEEGLPVAGADGLNAFEDDGEDAEPDDPEEDDVESAAGRGIREKDDAPEVLAAGIRFRRTKAHRACVPYSAPARHRQKMTFLAFIGEPDREREGENQIVVA